MFHPWFFIYFSSTSTSYNPGGKTLTQIPYFDSSGPGSDLHNHGRSRHLGEWFASQNQHVSVCTGKSQSLAPCKRLRGWW